MAEETTQKPFCVDRAKTGRAGCKGCKAKCEAGELRLGKVVPSPYGENQQMKSWYHVNCFMTALLKQRPVTKRIDSIDDIGDWEHLNKDDQEFLIKEINSMEKLYEQKYPGKYIAKLLKNETSKSPLKPKTPSKQCLKENKQEISNDDKFDQFTKLCNAIAKVDAYTDKTAIVQKFFTNGTDKTSFNGSLNLWCKFLLPQVNKRVYNLKSKQLIKIFSRILVADQDEMLTHLENGDVSETIPKFFQESLKYNPAQNSTLTLQEVEEFLENLSKLTKEEEQIQHFKTLIRRCTINDMRSIIRLIKGDLRINAGPKHILEAVHPDAYNAFQTSRDLDMVLDRIKSQKSHKSVSAKLELMTPVLPMLAEACKSVDMAMAKCPNGMFSEIKYDGERVQVHKKGSEFRYYSRALKPVQSHKVSHFKDYLPQAFPEGEDLVLDAEVLMVDLHTGKPLPFGSLGIHKRAEFKDAQVCLYVFDCLYYNGQVLLDIPIRKRRKILLEHMREVKNHVMFSEQQLIRTPGDLAGMIAKVLQLGLEGLVLKDLESTYEPGKRHWLKVKKDYLFDGAMADTADLVVLGAWYGTGKKGGMMSVFLMGCQDVHNGRWVTVTKVHTGHDDQTLERLQTELDPLMLKISQDFDRVPAWLHCNKGLAPDFVAINPEQMPVWEITGTEFTKANIHTADGISVRFPRVTRIRSDKNWKTATNLEELKHLYKTSKEKTDVTLLNQLAEKANSDVTIKTEDNSPSKTKSKHSKPSSSKDHFNASDEIGSPPSKKHKIESKKMKTLDEYFAKNQNKSDVDISDAKHKTNASKTKSLESNKRKHLNDEDSGSSKRHKSEIDHLEYMNTKVKIEKESPTKKKDKSPKDNKTKKEIVIKREEYDERRDSKTKEKKIKTENNDHTYRNSKVLKSYDYITTDTQKHKNDQKDINNYVTNAMNKDSKTESKSDENEETLKEKEEFKKNSTEVLPDIFRDFKFAFYPSPKSFDEETRKFLERHLIAFDGKTLESYKSGDPDFVVHLYEVISSEKVRRLKRYIPFYARHVHYKWLLKCIDEKELCDTSGFNITIVP